MEWEKALRVFLTEYNEVGWKGPYMGKYKESFVCMYLPNTSVF